MCDNLIIDPNKLYKLYHYKNIKEYYHFNFLPEYNSIEIDIFYDILNNLNSKNISSLNNYIFKHWSVTKLNINLEDKSERKEKILERYYSYNKINNKDDLNNKLNEFINNDKIIGLYIMNILLRFLYPCNI
jgi:hypothetical protein